MKYKSEHLPFLIIIILIVIEFVFFLSTDWGKNCRNRLKGNISVQNTTDDFNSRCPATKRYFFALNLQNNPELIAECKKIHEHVYPEFSLDLTEAGIANMEIYLSGDKLFMVLETGNKFDLQRDFKKLGELSSQKEWQSFVKRFQDTNTPGSIEKWKEMERIFKFGQSND
ncbi:L-rhamnose mutarotase [Mariniphaga sediminis]|uniref:L-rhamnose mutarotase n=1 Tax=Mariniphaga sediminis TaxID=1628158 RepID=UPI00356181E9